jgi:hypothetical protein
MDVKCFRKKGDILKNYFFIVSGSHGYAFAANASCNKN